MLGVLGAIALAALVTLLVVQGDDDGDQVTAGTSTTSSSTTSTSTSTTSTTTTPASTTTPPTTAAPATTTPPTTVVMPVVTGQGAVLGPPPSGTVRTMSGNDCTTLADDEWTATCGTVNAKDASLVWLIETTTTPSGGPGRRALVRRKSIGNSWTVVQEVRDDNGVRFSNVTARVADLSGDGKDEVAFGFHLTAGDGVLSLDVVEGPGAVVVHRELTRGVARVSSGQLDTWRRSDSTRYVHDVIQFRNGAWRIVATATVPANDVPPSQL